MTSATFPRGSRRRVRIAAAAAGLTAALVMTACSSGGDSDSADKSPTPSATSTGDSGGGSGKTSGPKGKLEGSWLATKNGKAVALIITGKQAALFVTGGTVCSGTAGKESGMRMIHLTCSSGAKDRTDGMVDSVSAKTLQITWSGSVGKETYTKAGGNKVPTDLPTPSAS